MAPGEATDFQELLADDPVRPCSLLAEPIDVVPAAWRSIVKHSTDLARKRVNAALAGMRQLLPESRAELEVYPPVVDLTLQDRCVPTEVEERHSQQQTGSGRQKR